MTQNPLIDSGTQSSKTPGLKPALAAALASLEVQLDQELARYRRTRTGSRTLNQPRVGNYISSQPQQFTAFTTTSDKTQPSIVEINTNAPPASVPANPQDNSAPAIVKAEELDNHKIPSSPDAKTQTPPSPPNSSSIVPAVVKATNSENIVRTDNTPKQPDDYLESSEALLRSLTEEQPETKKPDNSSDSLLSPLGIGSILLLLMASLTLGYVVFNPKSLPQLNLSKLSNGDSSPTAENTEGVESNAQSQSPPQLTPIPKYPNLAAKEFPEVRDPNDVVGLKPKVQPNPIAVPNPVAPENPANPQVALPNPIAVQQPTNPIATTPLPNLNSPPTSTAKTSPEPIATPLKPNTEIKLAADGYYHIVIDNQGLQALASARQVVPDAYLSRNQKLIYLGALRTKEQVQRKLQELQAKGIKARIEQQ